MSITLFKTQQLKYSPNAIKHIYFYLYREVNKEVARKQHQMMQLLINPSERRHPDLTWRPFFRQLGLRLQFTKVKDVCIMFKAGLCVELCTPDALAHLKQIRLDVYTAKELRGMLRMNKVKGRSKLKTKREMAVALMKM